MNNKIFYILGLTPIISVGYGKYYPDERENIEETHSFQLCIWAPFW